MARSHNTVAILRHIAGSPDDRREFGRPFSQVALHFTVVPIGVRMDEVRCVAVVLCRRRAVTAGRGDHREAFEAIVHLGIPLEGVLRSG